MLVSGGSPNPPPPLMPTREDHLQLAQPAFAEPLAHLDVERIGRHLVVDEEDSLLRRGDRTERADLQAPGTSTATGLAMYTCRPAWTAASACSGKKCGGVSSTHGLDAAAITRL